MKAARTTAITLLYCALAMAGTTIASAPIATDGDRVTVSFADLNIHSDAGARSLYSRLKRASAMICDTDTLNRRSLGESIAAKSCYVETLDRFVSQIESDTLKEMHAG